MGIVEFMLFFFFLSKLGFAVLVGAGLWFIIESVKEEEKSKNGS